MTDRRLGILFALFREGLITWASGSCSKPEDDSASVSSSQEQERRELLARARDSLDFSLARPYQVLDVSEVPVVGVPYDVFEYRVWVYFEDARTRAERAQTALKLAMEIQVEKVAWWVATRAQW